MNLEQALHQRWAENTPLSALLPADKLFTGRATGATLPCATILRRARRTVCRTNSGAAIEEVSFEIRLLHPSLDDAIAIVRKILAAFDRSQFSLPGGGNVLNLRRIEERPTQLDDGTWQFQIEFLANIQLPTP